MDEDLMTPPWFQTEAPTEPLPSGDDMDGGYFAAVLGAVITTVILVLLVLVVVLIRYMFRHKGSYQTNEAKGTEFAETADVALRHDPTLHHTVDASTKEYFI